jgi:hypothetical protein
VVFTQAHIKMGTRKSFWGKAQVASKPDSLTAISKMTFKKMGNPRHLTRPSWHVTGAVCVSAEQLGLYIKK